MKNILVAYDLRSESQQARDKKTKDINDFLKQICKKDLVKILNTTYLLNTDYSCVEVRDGIMKIVDSNDSVWVGIVSEWAALNIQRLDPFY